MEQKNQATAVSTNPKAKVDILKGILNAPSVMQQFQNALKENSNSFIASVIDLYNSDSGLQECEPKKVVMECLKAATLKLPINKALGFAYVIKFNNKIQLPDNTWTKVPTPTFIPGYKGYIQLAMRTGQYRTINADIVYEGEIQKVNKLTGELRFDGTKTSDKVVGYFAYFELLNGFNKTLYVELEDMAKHAKKYSLSIKTDNKVSIETLKTLAGKDPTGLGWTGGFDDMAIKTVLRNLLSKYGYLSVEMQNAISDDINNDEERKNPEPIQIIDIDDTQVVNENQSQSAGTKSDLPPYLQNQ